MRLVSIFLPNGVMLFHPLVIPQCFWLDWWVGTPCHVIDCTDDLIYTSTFHAHLLNQLLQLHRSILSTNWSNKMDQTTQLNRCGWYHVDCVPFLRSPSWSAISASLFWGLDSLSDPLGELAKNLPGPGKGCVRHDHINSGLGINRLLPKNEERGFSISEVL